MNDPQFGTSLILRPFAGFEAIYNGGSAADIPLMFTQGGVALDENAGKPGYSPLLARGIRVPMGARALIWLPRIMAGGSPGVLVPYEWRFQWRLRNVFDYRQSRTPFHYPKQGEGIPDGADARVVIPSAFHAIIYNQAEVSSDTSISFQHILQERVGVYNGPLLGRPLMPDGSLGVLQQGVLPVAGAQPQNLVGSFICHEIMCCGDELLLGVSRASSNGVGTWEFGGQDVLMSTMFGNTAAGSPYPDIGVYLHVGTSG